MNETELMAKLVDVNKAIQGQHQANPYSTGNTIEDEYADMEIYIQLLEEKVDILEQLI